MSVIHLFRFSLLLLFGVQIDVILNKASKHFCSGQWSNIAIRWINLRYNDTPSYIKLRSNEEFVGGLEVIITISGIDIYTIPIKNFYPFTSISTCFFRPRLNLKNLIRFKFCAHLISALHGSGPDWVCTSS